MRPLGEHEQPLTPGQLVNLDPSHFVSQVQFVATRRNTIMPLQLSTTLPGPDGNQQTKKWHIGKAHAPDGAVREDPITQVVQRLGSAKPATVVLSRDKLQRLLQANTSLAAENPRAPPLIADAMARSMNGATNTWTAVSEELGTE